MAENIESLEQKRAEFAYNCANIEERKKDSKYSKYVKNIPMLIKTNGLGATVAFIYCKSKKEGAYGWIYYDLYEWLKKTGHLKETKLVEILVKNFNSPEYKAITIEVLAFLKWLKRFAEAFAPDDKNNKGKKDVSQSAG